MQLYPVLFEAHTAIWNYFDVSIEVLGDHGWMERKRYGGPCITSVCVCKVKWGSNRSPWPPFTDPTQLSLCFKVPESAFGLLHTSNRQVCLLHNRELNSALDSRYLKKNNNNCQDSQCETEREHLHCAERQNTHTAFDLTLHPFQNTLGSEQSHLFPTF